MKENHLATSARTFDANLQNSHGVVIENSYYGRLYDCAQLYFLHCIVPYSTAASSSSTTSDQLLIIRENEPDEMDELINAFINNLPLSTEAKVYFNGNLNEPLSELDKKILSDAFINKPSLSAEAKAYLHRKFNEPLCELDRKVLTITENGKSSSITVFFPLKSNFGIVLKSILDHDKWDCGIEKNDTPEEKAEKQKKALADRLMSLTELIEKQPFVDKQRLYCHVGVTEDWVQLLNGFQGETLAMDDDDFNRAGIRDYVFVILRYGFPTNSEQSIFDYIQDQLHSDGILLKEPLTRKDIRTILLDLKERKEILKGQASAIWKVIKPLRQISFSLPELEALITTDIQAERKLSQTHVDRVLVAFELQQKPQRRHPVTQEQFETFFKEWLLYKQSMPSAILERLAAALPQSPAPSSSSRFQPIPAGNAHSLQTYLEQCYLRKLRVNIHAVQDRHQKLFSYCNRATLKNLNCDFSDKLAFIDDWIKRYTKYKTVGDKKPRNFAEALAPQVLDWLRNSYSIEDPACAEQLRFITRLYDTWRVIEVDCYLLAGASTHFFEFSYFAKLQQLLQAGITGIHNGVNDVPTSSSSSSIDTDNTNNTDNASNVNNADDDDADNKDKEFGKIKSLSLHELLTHEKYYADLKKFIETFSKKRSLLHLDTCKEFIENFLEKSLHAAAVNDVITQIELILTLASICLRDENEGLEIIRLKDSTTDNIFADAQAAHIRWLTDNITNPGTAKLNDSNAIWLDVYWINRLILCALIKPPAEWSPSLALNLRQVCQFIRNYFNEPITNKNATTLKNLSYPETLLTHLDYLIIYYEYELELRAYNERVSTHFIMLEQSPDGLISRVEEQAPRMPEKRGNGWIFSPQQLNGVLHQFDVIARLYQHSAIDSEKMRWILRHVLDVDAQGLHQSRHGSMGPRPVTNLMVAAEDGNIALARTLIAAGADPNIRDLDGVTALQKAVLSRHADCVRLLLTHHADINAHSPHMRTPLMLAVSSNEPAIAQLLLNYKPNLRFKDSQSNTAQHLAVTMNNPDMLALFVDIYVTEQNFTPLELAILDGDEGFAQLMIQQSTDLELCDNTGNTALSLAIQNQRPSVIAALLERNVKINIQDNRGYTPLMVAILTSQVELALTLIARDDIELELRNVYGQSALFFAIQYKCKPIFDALLQQGVDIHTPDKNGITPLMHTVITGQEALLETLVRRGADFIHTSDNKGMTPVMHAVIAGQQALLETLVRRGADFEPCNQPGWASDLGIPVDELSSNSTLLMRAVGHGDITVVGALVIGGANLEVVDRQNLTALHRAAQSGYAGGVRLLLAHGANVNAQDSSGLTPLWHAVINGAYMSARLLIAAGADLEAIGLQKLTVLHWAMESRDVDLVSLLLEHGANVNAQDERGETPLMKAVAADQVAVAKLLLDKKPALDLKNTQNQTAQHIAVSMNNRAMLALFIDVYLTQDDIAPLALAIEYSQESLAFEMIHRSTNLELRTETGETALSLAIWKQHSSITTALLKRKVNINIQNLLGYNPLMAVILMGQVALALALIARDDIELELCSADTETALSCAISQKLLPVIDALLQKGVNINTRDLWGNTPLMRAIQFNVEGLPPRLIAHSNIKLELRNKQGQSALFFAIQYKREPIFDALLQQGVDIHTPDNNGITPLMYAIITEQETLMQTLIRHGADLEPCNQPGWASDLGIPVDALSPNSTVLMRAVKDGHLRSARAWVIGGANLEVVNRQSLTALHWAVLEGHADLVSMLLEHGANIDAQDERQRTPLIIAVTANQLAIAKLLLDKKPALELMNRDDETAQDIAVRMNNRAMKALFINIYVTQQDLMPLSHAIMYNQENFALDIIRQSDHLELNNEASKTALALAVRYNRRSVMAKLLEKNANIFAQDENRRSLLIAFESNFIDKTTIALIDKNTYVGLDEQQVLSLMNCAIEGRLDFLINRLLLLYPDIAIKVNFGRNLLLFFLKQNFYLSAETLIHTRAEYLVPDAQGKTALHYVAESGNTVLFKLLLKKMGEAVNVNAVDEQGATPLMVAIAYRHIRLIHLLINQGAHLDVQDKYGNTALMCVLVAGTKEGGDIAPLALGLRTALSKIARQLIHANAELSLTDFRGRTALHLAVRYANVKTIHLLLKRAANQPNILNAQDNKGMTPLMLVIYHRKFAVAKLLILAGADVAFMGFEGQTALHIAVYRDSISMVNLLLAHETGRSIINLKNIDGLTPLNLATSLPLAQQLVEAGADIGLVSINAAGQNSLHLAILKHISNYTHLGASHDPSSAKLHMLVSSSPQAQRPRMTPFLEAMQQERRNLMDLIRWLSTQEKGRPLVDAADGQGMTPRMWLEQYEPKRNRPYFEADDRIISRAETSNTHTSSAVPSRDVLFGYGLGQPFGYGIDRRSLWSSPPIQAPVLRAKVATSTDTAHEIHIATPLLQALTEGTLQTAKALIHAGADLSACDAKGDTALHIAIKHRYYATAKLLLEQGASINSQNHKGRTPLMLALRNHEPTCVYAFAHRLIAMGADLTLTDKLGQNALHYAIRYTYALHIGMPTTQKVSPIYLFGQDPYSRAAPTTPCAVNLGDTSRGYGKITHTISTGQTTIAPKKRPAPQYVTEVAKTGSTMLANPQQYRITALIVALIKSDAVNAIINTLDYNGLTPLMLAVFRADINMVRILLEHGANPHVEDNAGHHALDHAEKQLETLPAQRDKRQYMQNIARLLTRELFTSQARSNLRIEVNGIEGGLECLRQQLKIPTVAALVELKIRLQYQYNTMILEQLTNPHSQTILTNMLVGTTSKATIAHSARQLLDKEHLQDSQTFLFKLLHLLVSLENPAMQTHKVLDAVKSLFNSHVALNNIPSSSMTSCSTSSSDQIAMSSSHTERSTRTGMLSMLFNRRNTSSSTPDESLKQLKNFLYTHYRITQTDASSYDPELTRKWHTALQRITSPTTGRDIMATSAKAIYKLVTYGGQRMGVPITDESTMTASAKAIPESVRRSGRGRADTDILALCKILMQLNQPDIDVSTVLSQVKTHWAECQLSSGVSMSRCSLQ